MSSPLVGAWELVSDTDQGVAVFTYVYLGVTVPVVLNNYRIALA